MTIKCISMGHRSRGATMVEYSVLVLMVIVVCVVSITDIGAWISETFERLECEFDNTCE